MHNITCMQYKETNLSIAQPLSLQADSGLTKVLLDVRAVEGLVEVLEVAQVCIQARPVPQLRTAMPRCQHAHYQSRTGRHMLQHNWLFTHTHAHS